jgi:hypothetical protein
VAGVEEVELMGEVVEERERTRGCESMLFILKVGWLVDVVIGLKFGE